MTTKKQAPLGLVLRGLRAKVGITQQEHAEALDTSPGSLSKIETGHKKVAYERLFEMIAALNVGAQAETQARLAILHGDGLLSESELAVLLAHHSCWPLLCLYKSHATFGQLLGTCSECGAPITCRPEGHRCPNGCGSGGPALRETGRQAHSRFSLEPTEALPCER